MVDPAEIPDELLTLAEGYTAAWCTREVSYLCACGTCFDSGGARLSGWKLSEQRVLVDDAIEFGRDSSEP
jgi:hypothetical protein